MNAVKPYTKLLFIIGLTLALLLPQTSLLQLIKERANWRQQAMNNIAQSWPGEQVITGPLLTVPYTIHEYGPDDSGPGREGKLLLMPEKLTVDALLDTTERYRGIHKVQVYQTRATISGQFSLDKLAALKVRHGIKRIEWGVGTLHYAVSDQRGIINQPVVQWGAEEFTFEPGSMLADLPKGMHATVSAIDDEQVTATAKPMTFKFVLKLKGMQSVHFAQIAKDINIQLTSNWRHPSFVGKFLPEERSINKQGFTARWQSSAFSNGAEELLESCTHSKCIALKQNAIGVTLVQPVNVFSLSERSVKYAILFIVLSFTALLLFELLKKLRIHPVQYLLIGLALTVFYLLLISMSEHMNFALAYSMATLASTGLLTLYFSAILHDRKAGILLGTSLLLLYGVLYVILQAEDHALLMGSLLLFAILALLMLSTRNLDWYALLETHLPKAERSASEELSKA